MPYRLTVKTIVKPDPRKISNTLEMDPEEPIQPGFKRVLTSLGRLEDTLKQLEVNSRSSDTEVWHKPREGGKKVYCRVRCNVITVGEIDTVKQEFEAEIYLSLRWKEEHFKGKTREDIDWNECWDPRVYFFNAVNIDKLECKHNIVPNDDDSVDGIPDAQLSIRMKATFKTAMQLHSFPYDHQKLTIKLMSDWPLDVVEFVKDMSIKDSIRIDTFTGHHEWTLHKHVLAHAVEEDRAKTGSHRQYPIYHISTHVQRQSMYYLWNIALVIFLILGLSFTSFSVEASAPADRLSVTVTLLLTAVAFKFVVSSNLPTISYLTLLDKYVLWSLVFQCLMVVQNAVAVVFYKHDMSDIFDYICMGGLGGFVLIGNAAFIIAGIVKNSSAKDKLDKLTRQYLDLCDDINQRWQTRQQRKRDRDIAKENQSQMPASEKPSQPNPSPTPATKRIGRSY
ncbi:putative gamma-aminobutyric acid receptor subunit gamma-2 isoform X2 [Apostichopus japonicus]|uniref:Putative gamma-aminobutyric acid receptor subunit gamma-2 isoform X2 n=1 Tax=Stichopus japonicus TaxID=307972 RepID=A0A2G8KWQ5_STIJA|nr:putative gamma-aminobutyric acid receptor subunit gamma-2 isoform X2 [Apostichopus japonicus]